MPIRAVIFDRGNALVKERTGEEVLQQVLNPLGLAGSKEALAKAQAASRAFWAENYRDKPRGERWNRSIRRECLSAALFSLGVRQEGEEVLDRLDQYWDVFRLMDLQFGVRPCLAALQGARLPMGVLAQSLRSSTEIRGELERLGIGRYFFLIFSAEDAPYDKPDPRLFTLMAEKMGFVPGDVMFVGGNYEQDAVGAAGAGMTPVIVSRKEVRQVAGVNYLRTLAEVPALVANINAALLTATPTNGNTSTVAGS